MLKRLVILEMCIILTGCTDQPQHGQNKANHTLSSIIAIQATCSKAFYPTAHKQGDTTLIHKLLIVRTKVRDT